MLLIVLLSLTTTTTTTITATIGCGGISRAFEPQRLFPGTSSSRFALVSLFPTRRIYSLRDSVWPLAFFFLFCFCSGYVWRACFVVFFQRNGRGKAVWRRKTRPRASRTRKALIEPFLLSWLVLPCLFFRLPCLSALITVREKVFAHLRPRLSLVPM